MILRNLVFLFFSFVISIVLFLAMNYMIKIDLKNLSFEEERKVYIKSFKIPNKTNKKSKPKNENIKKDIKDKKPKPIKKVKEPLGKKPKIIKHSTSTKNKSYNKSPLKPSQNIEKSLDIKKEELIKNIDSKFAILKVEPNYPRKARKRGIEGRVSIKFKINSNGDIFDINIIASSPKNIFDYEAINAVKKWKFNKSNKKLRTSSVTFIFKLNQ